VITLDEVSIPGNAKLTGRGEIDLSQNQWWLWFGGSNFALTKPKDSVLGFNLLASGAGQYAHLQELLVRVNAMNFWLSGAYDARLPKPVAADLHIWKERELATSSAPELARGDVRASGHLLGTLWPRNLDIQ